MKKLSKVLVLVLSTIMVLAMSASVFAAETGSITITPPTNVDASATNTYKIYKVFDAKVNEDDNTKVSYSLCEGDTLSEAMIAAGFSVDTAGNVTGPDSLNEAAIAAIAAYVTADDLEKTVTSTGTASASAADLPFGYYYITTSTGSVVTIDSNNNNPTVNDKNTVPDVEKTITTADSLDADGKKALAEVGKKVEYKSEITVGKGSKNLAFHDTMGAGLTYNNDVTVTANPAVTIADWYTVKETPDDGETITITFKDGIAENTKITITYSATVNSDALTVDTGKNTATVSYGDESSYSSTPDVTNVYNAQFTVNKKDGEGKPLEGAGFVIKNAAGKYYKFTAATETTSAKIEWVDSINDATEYFSGADGKVQAFTGLANGTYTLEEKTVPKGYNKADDSTFTVDEHDYTDDNLKRSANVTNNAGTELPSTGGIGTTIFYVLGSLLVVGCGIVLVSRKRMQNNK